MRVETLFFAAYRELVGASRLGVDVPEGCTVAELVASLRARGQPWAALPESPAVAVNRSLSDQDLPLSPGDEVAFLPPVAGG